MVKHGHSINCLCLSFISFTAKLNFNMSKTVSVTYICTTKVSRPWNGPEFLYRWPGDHENFNKVNIIFLSVFWSTCLAFQTNVTCYLCCLAKQFPNFCHRFVFCLIYAGNVTSSRETSDKLASMFHDIDLEFFAQVIICSFSVLIYTSRITISTISIVCGASKQFVVFNKESGSGRYLWGTGEVYKLWILR